MKEVSFITGDSIEYVFSNEKFKGIFCSFPNNIDGYVGIIALNEFYRNRLKKKDFFKANGIVLDEGVYYHSKIVLTEKTFSHFKNKKDE